MYQQLELDMADDGFGLVPDCGDLFEEVDRPGKVPSSLDQLCDWLDIVGEEEQTCHGKLPTTSAPNNIQHFPTFSTDDKWPI